MKNRLQFGIIVLFLIAIALITEAQTHSFEKVLTRQGEANLSVRQVVQDKNGFLWLATFNGLYRFEGDEFVIQHSFLNNREINNDVTSLIEDNNNNLWIGTNNGLLKYDLKTEELITYYYDKSKPGNVFSNKIRSLCKDNNGQIWVGTNDAGLFIYNQGKDIFEKIVFDSLSVKPPTYIKTIFSENNGKMWVGTLGDGIYSFKRTESGIGSVYNFRTENQDFYLSNNYVYCVFQDTNGSIAVGTREGLNLFNEKENRFQQIKSPDVSAGSMTNYFRSIIRDKSGKLWIGTWGGLILCNSFSDLENGTFEVAEHNRNIIHSISNNQIMNILQDNSGIIWLGTENGLNRFDPYQNQFQPLVGDVINSLKEQTATVISPYKEGILIVTFLDGILFKKGSEITKPFKNLLKDFSNEKFYSVLIDSKENIWLGSYRGLLLKIDPKNKSISSFRHSHNSNPIISLLESENGLILVGTLGEGLKYFNKKTEIFSVETNLPGDYLMNDMHFDKTGNLWIATQHGIYKNNRGSSKFESYLPENADSIVTPNIFFDVEETKTGEIVAGSRNGLFLYDKSSNKFYKKKFNNGSEIWITNIKTDSKQDLWLNLNFNRIARWDTSTALLQYFNVNNGIRSIPYNQRAFYIDEDDLLYLSGFDQIYQFNTSDVIINRYSPAPVFTKLVINNSDIYPGQVINNQEILKSSIKFQKSILLNQQNKDFTISFNSSSYLNSRDNKYRYFLHGYDKEWHIGSERFAHYTNLSPGKYRFEVFSANNDGFWSDNPSKLEIRVKPSPFLSFWAVIIYLIVTVVLFYEIRRIILSRVLLNRELLIERVKRDKEEKFNQERLRFYTNISHELRTPLTLIMGPIKQLISEEKEESRNSKLLHLILINSQRLLYLVNQLLDFRKSLHEGIKLKTTYFNLVDAVKLNFDAFDFIANEKSIYVKFSPESNVIKGWFDREKLDIILFNILSNAFKYTPDGGLVQIELKKINSFQNFPTSHVEIKISNTGKGIPKSLHEKVFERFYQVNNDSSSILTGSGIGLSAVKSLVELHKGKIILESEPDKLTSFIISLPSERDAYSDEEIFDFKRDASRRTKELINNLKQKIQKENYQVRKTRFQKVLIVEDNDDLREFLFEYLSADYQIFTASDGVTGLKICETENPGLIISDVMMDNMDGVQFCKKVKSTPEISHIPVILMTAMASVENKLTGYKAGADDYITKPFEPELLKIRIRNILDNIEKARKSFSSNVHISATDLTISKIDEDFLNQVIGLLESNLDNSDLDIEKFCKDLRISSSQLYRKIKNITDLSPNEFIRIYRLKKAAVLIKNSNQNISEIAYKVGFNDALYFSKCFKKQFGVSPSRFSEYK